MLSHTVLFRLRRPLGEGDKEKLVAALEEFAAEAPLAAGPAIVGADLGLRDAANPKVADASLSTTFADADTFARYLAHPRHVALVKEVLEPSCEGWLSVQADVSA
ncbi:hypothetical protein GCM10009836_32140 [Pseudonocardia ailaonensis]|uniref:Stress-response A/B barrel domain-containing protein n=1 Tax=Pseudonocardia ailaonensis TaxID=367279 RepID=A0ABN2N2N1_9PSEU